VACTFSALASGKLGFNGTGFMLAIFSAESEPTTTNTAITSCDLEPISWEYVPMKHHDTGVLLLTWAICAVRDRIGRKNSGTRLRP
jgi:hypothetical protein